MATICIIPARGGSQRIPRKNIKLFHGKPIIAYSIQKAAETGMFDRIIVSTDEGAIADVAIKYGAEPWIRSDEYYSRDNVGTQEVVAECLRGIYAYKYDDVCCIYATAPLMKVENICHGFAVLNNYAGINVDYAFSVGYPPLHDAGQFYWGLADSFLKNIPLVSEFSRMICVDPNRDCDINTMADWKRALKMYEDLGE